MLLTEFGGERWEATSKKRSIDSGGTPVFQAMLRFAQQCFYGVKGRGGRKMSGKNFNLMLRRLFRRYIVNRSELYFGFNFIRQFHVILIFI